MTAIIAALTRCPAMLKSMGNITKGYINYNKDFNKCLLFFSASKNNNREAWQFSTIPAASSSDEDVNE